MSLRPIVVHHTVCYRGKPLAVFQDLPGHDAELSPAQMRAYAAALLQAADDCEAIARPCKGRKASAVRRSYEIGEHSA